MLGRRDIAKLISLAVPIVAAAALWLGPYRVYCEADHSKNHYCAIYEFSVALGGFVEIHGNGITAFATLAIALFTWTLWRSSEKMWTATQDALRHAEETAERQLRAYVHVARGGIKFDSPETSEWHLEIKNFGQTPAYNVRQWTHIWITAWPLQETLPAPPADFQTAKSILAPGGLEIMVWIKSPPIPTKSLPLIGTRSGTIYIYGEIRYVDAFQKERFTKYRLIYGGPRDHGSGAGSLMPDHDGNDAT